MSARSHAEHDADLAEYERGVARTPIAAALVAEGHDALTRTLDEGLRHRITEAVSVAGFVLGSSRDYTPEEAAVTRRIYAQADDWAACVDCKHPIEEHGGMGCRVVGCSCRAYVQRLK